MRPELIRSVCGDVRARFHWPLLRSRPLACTGSLEVPPTRVHWQLERRAGGSECARRDGVSASSGVCECITRRECIIRR